MLSTGSLIFCALLVTLFLSEIVQNTDIANSPFCLYRKLSNQIKNRYSDVLCLDHSRVQLCKLDGDDEVIICCSIIRKPPRCIIDQSNRKFALLGSVLEEAILLCVFTDIRLHQWQLHGRVQEG